jgi:hypothetical protein
MFDLIIKLLKLVVKLLKLVVVALLLSSPACGGRRRVGDTLYLCDHTTSSRCDEESVRKAGRPFIVHPEPGSRFELMLVGCGSDDADTVDIITVPERWGSGATQKKRAWMEAEERHLGDLRLKRPQRCSGVVGGIARAASRLHEGGRAEKKLLIHSDMREVSAETGFNFERSIPAPGDFVEAVRERGLMPVLRGIEVTVCGVHSDSTPDARRWSAKQTIVLQAAWTAYFRAAGVDHVQFLETCPWEKAENAEVATLGSVQ